ncbi:MAG: PAS domain-containing protein [Blastocatellia bacterium]|nr:PAS domain-containing protein [Blastocatellia bacterium]
MEEHAIVVADKKGNIHLWSPGAQALFGYTQEEAIGRSLDLIVPEPYREQHWAGFNQVMSTGISKLDGEGFDAPVHCKDGEIEVFLSRFSLLRDARNHPVGAMMIFVRPEEGESLEAS